MNARSNVIAFPGVERELILELATALERYGAGEAVLRGLRQARRLDIYLMHRAYAELERLGAHPWLLAVVGSWQDGLSCSEALRTLKEMNAGTFKFEVCDGPEAR